MRRGVLRLGAPQLPRACRLAWAIFLVVIRVCRVEVLPHLLHLCPKVPHCLRQFLTGILDGLADGLRDQGGQGLGV